MGEYLTIKLRKEAEKDADENAKTLNRLWREFADEEEEKEYPINFYDRKCGYTLNFLTWNDIVESGKYMRDKQGIEVGRKEECRRDLGFYPEMTDEEAGRQYQKIFPGAGYGDVGSCQIKLSGMHYCYHSLEKVKAFLNLPEVSELVSSNEERGGMLDEYIGYKEKIITSRYCKRCKELAERHGIEIPLWHGGTGKSVMWTDEFMSLQKVIDNIKDEEKATAMG
jgi:hypothetical protein